MPPKKTETQAADQVQAAPPAEGDSVTDPATAPDRRLRALHPVRHNGTLYGHGLPDGDEFNADPAAAAALLGLAVVEPLDEEAAE